MMNSPFLYSLLAFCLLVSPSLSLSSEEDNSYHLRRQSNPTRRNTELCHLLCEIDVIGFLYSSEEDDSDSEESVELEGNDVFLCRLQEDPYNSRTGYQIDLPVDFIGLYREEIESGTSSVCISGGEVDRESHKILVAEGAELTLVSNRRRERKLNTDELAKGTRSVLAVQLTSSFVKNSKPQREDPGMNRTQIEGSIFGTGPNAPGHDLVSQYKACSYGALNLQPATGPNIVDGVAEVRLGKPIAGGEILGSLQDDILEATEAVVGSIDQYSHVIYCIPDDSLMDGSTKWTAFTYFHSHWSFFQRRRCSAMSVTIHELGHNLGFRHSGYGSETYGDESGYMGFTVYKTGAPLKCFNGHKHWLSGWFQDRATSIDPDMDEPVLRRMVSFADYDKELDTRDVVLLRINRYFLQYNRAKGFNAGTETYADQVSITYAQTDSSDSKAVGGLSAGEKITLSDFRNSGDDLVIEVCEFGSFDSTSVGSSTSKALEKDASSLIDYAWVSIHLDDGDQQSQCSLLDQTPSPTKSPTRAPTDLPTTDRPTNMPTSNPTMPPTATPSSTPLVAIQVEEVTEAPTEAPTSETRVSNTFVVTTSDLLDKPQPEEEENAPISQMEKLQKRRQIPDIKRRNRLTKTEDAQPAIRRRLKGNRV